MPRARWRQRLGRHASVTGWCSRPGARNAASRRSRRRRRPSRRFWPARPTRHDRAPRGGDRGRAPRAGSSEPVRLRCGRRGDVRDAVASMAAARCAGLRRSRSTRSRGCSSLSTPRRTRAGATGRCCSSGSPRRRDARSWSHSTSRISSSTPPGGSRSRSAAPRPTRSGQEPPWRCRTRARETDALSGRSRRGSPPPRSTVARCSDRCAVATSSPTGASQTSPSR
jgi:hypothetical protein